ncbi:MAG: short-chain fatty acyl-CoA regulator family protein [Nannocystaceae bacterium]
MATTKKSRRLGSRVRALRQKEGLTQVEFARRLGISASYLNLIEHNQRSLTAPLLLKIVEELKVDLQDFNEGRDDHLASALAEVFSDALLVEHEISPTEMQELLAASPSISRAVVTLYRALRSARESADSLAGQIYDTQQVPETTRSQLPSEEVSDFIQHHGNYFPDLEQAAEALWAEASLEPDELYHSLSQYVTERLGMQLQVTRLGGAGGALRHFDPERGRLRLSSLLSPASRVFQLGAQIGLSTLGELLDRLVDDPGLTSDSSRRLGRVVLANYFAGAVAMPYERILEAAQAERYDLELLGHRFGASFEQVCHRLTSLRRPGAEGIALHMIRVDMAGNISKRFSASGIRFARFSGACPRWNVFGAFQTPNLIRVQISVMPDGEPFFCVARTVPKSRGGYHEPTTIQAIGLGCQLPDGRNMVYSEGIDLDDLDGGVPVGVTCRLCPRRDCGQRAFPSLRDPLIIDENVRGPSFYTHPGEVDPDAGPGRRSRTKATERPSRS